MSIVRGRLEENQTYGHPFFGQRIETHLVLRDRFFDTHAEVGSLVARKLTLKPWHVFELACAFVGEGSC
jgi:hypothetical protein